MISRGLLTPILCVAAPFATQAARAETPPQQHVQGFYTWYVQVAVKEHQEPAFVSALKQKKWLFSPELARALNDDAAAQEKAQGVIVGIDWDPFLNSQDPGNEYKVGSVSTKGDLTLVEVFAVHGGKREKTPSVIVEMRKYDGRWMFTNFRRADGGDLLSALEAFRKSRR